MTPAEIMIALARCGTRIAIEGERVRLIFEPGNPPPSDLVRAAREAKAALRETAATSIDTRAVERADQAVSVSASISATTDHEATPAPAGGVSNMEAEPSKARPARAPGAARTDEAQEPTGRYWLLLLKWGATPKEARKLAMWVDAAAGAPGTLRRAAVGELYSKLTKFGCSGEEKIERLRAWAAKMEHHPLYWPTSRSDRTAAARARRDKILRIMKAAHGHQVSKKKLIRVTGETPAAISQLILSMIKAGEIIQVRPGVYGLPGAEKHISGTEAVIRALWATLGHRMTRTELIDATAGQTTPSAIDRALHDMRKEGVLVDGQRGMVALSPATLRKIKRGESIHVGHNELVLEPSRLARCGKSR